MGSAFASIKTTPPPKTARFVYVPKNKGESSRKSDENLEMISVHPSFIRELITTSESLNFFN